MEASHLPAVETGGGRGLRWNDSGAKCTQNKGHSRELDIIQKGDNCLHLIPQGKSDFGRADLWKTGRKGFQIPK